VSKARHRHAHRQAPSISCQPGVRSCADATERADDEAVQRHPRVVHIDAGSRGLSVLPDTLEHMCETLRGGVSPPSPWPADDALPLAPPAPLPVSELGDDAVLSLLGGLERLKPRVDAEQTKALARFAALRPGEDPGVRRRRGRRRPALDRLRGVRADRPGRDADRAAARHPGRPRARGDRPGPGAGPRRADPAALRRARAPGGGPGAADGGRAEPVPSAALDPAGGAQGRLRRRAGTARPGTERRVGVQPREDAMADLAIFGGAAEVAAAYARVDALARAARAGRRVHVVVPVGALLGLTEEPAELAGYGQSRPAWPARSPPTPPSRPASLLAGCCAARAASRPGCVRSPRGCTSRSNAAAPKQTGALAPRPRATQRRSGCLSDPADDSTTFDQGPYFVGPRK